MKNSIPVFLFTLLIVNTNSISAQNKKLDIQGHRGCRGLMPENSIPAFIKALELGVTTLEMDVVISLDKKVVVSHEPWFNPEICITGSGVNQELKKIESLNIYRMKYEEIKTYDCGSKENPKFPMQEKIAVYKPLLSEVFDTVIAYCKKNLIAIPYFNIEIKSEAAYDKIYTPEPSEYCNLVMTVISQYSLNKNCIIQSFDIRSLKFMHLNFPKIPLAFLSESIKNVAEIKNQLGFYPEIFSPDKILVSQELINICHEKNIKVIPWTVNDTSQITELISWGVDGIITDYPNKLLKE